MKKRFLPMLLTLAMVLSIAPTIAGAVALSDVVDNRKSFTESVGVRYLSEFKMVYVEGGTFTLGWEEGTPGAPPDDTFPVENVKVSDYWIGETVVTQDLWNAVMGTAQPAAATRNTAHTSNTFYDVQEFLTRLYVLTGRVYYMPTEAQWEFAAKGGNPGHAAKHNLYPFPGSLVQADVAIAGTGPVKSRAPNILGIYDLSGCGSHGEWTWNSWNTAHIGGTDPTGIDSPIHSQKTRRGGLSSTGLMEYHSRLIRSIDGTGPSFRIALSADQSSVPPGMIFPRDIHVPKL
ncbi:MAG: formylglycine-generating enzyme family protein, partial [Oscillospiraceae bacterium]|nr:formylglycine-generating enzyme family protein [Oscillospiraceae bacterium]